VSGSDSSHSGAKAAVALGALGVVFGDIGTSPLYSMQTVFERDALRPVPVNTDAIYGVASTMFWTLVIVVAVKYLLLIMRADNDGEGGILSLIALLTGGARSKTGHILALAVVGVFGACLFFGDSMITPAISVLSAVEGLKVVSPSFDSLVVPIAIAILVLLFAVQQLGTAAVGRLFGPVMAVWFVTLALCGISGIADHPAVFQALSPTYVVDYFAHDGLTAFLSLGGVVLVITGSEAIYADMGHFGASPIRRAWFIGVFPALILNYLGQAALLVDHPTQISNPFFLLVPSWGRIPMVVLATMATVIASQAVISGAYSVARQAGSLGYLPRLRIVHTSEREEGQIYAPFVNWLLFVAVITLVLVFERSAKLAAAYGVAASGTIACTTFLFFVWARRRGRPLWQIVLGGAFFLGVDLALFSANLVKVLSGGWLPLLVAAALFTVMSTWSRGRYQVTVNRHRAEGSLDDFVEKLHEHGEDVRRVPGTAIFLHRSDETTPLALRANVEHNKSLHESAVVVSIHVESVPHVAPDERLEVNDLGYRDDGISHVTVRYGFQDDPDVPRALVTAPEKGLECEIDLDHASYFLSKIDLVTTDGQKNGMSAWRKRLFLATTNIATDPVDTFGLPRERTIIMGSHIEV
jgi:KUP system potassium uptake protein